MKKSLKLRVALVLASSIFAAAQATIPPAIPAAKHPTPPTDALGRTSPRGAVLGFLRAAGKGDYDTAAAYLNTPMRGPAAEDLARQLSVVLDRRLPTRLNELSDQPDGSIPFPTTPDLDLVGSIGTDSGDIDILLERVNRGKAGFLWLFSAKTLDAVPELYAEVETESFQSALPSFLVKTTIARIPLLQWLAMLLGVPLLLGAMALLNGLLSRAAGGVRRKFWNKTDWHNPEILPVPLRILLLGGTIRMALSRLPLPLLIRQFWSSASSVLTIVACVWLILMLTGWIEGRIRHRLIRRNLVGSVSILLLAHWAANLMIVLGGVFVCFRHFGLSPAAGVAGIGVGGIAVALAAQKTLENVIGGASIMFDRALRVGDLIKVGQTLGNVEDIGLRSTRIRTFDRTLISIPNGQLATVTLENLSLRDSYWFNHILHLPYQTTPTQVRAILEGVTGLLTRHPRFLRDSIRVRFLGFGAWSLKLELFAHLTAHDWAEFLDLQGEALLAIMEIVESAGTRLALLSQTTDMAISGADRSQLNSSINPAPPRSPKQSRDAA